MPASMRRQKRQVMGIVVCLSWTAAACSGSNSGQPPTVTFDGSADGTTPPAPDARVADAAADAPVMADAPVTPDAPLPDDSIHVDPVAGADLNAGTMMAPVKSIAKAAQMVKAGQTIVLADGTYDLQNQPSLDITFAVSAGIRGASPAGVVLKGSSASTGLRFAKGGEVEDVGFEDFGSAITVAGGTFVAAGVRFANVGLPCQFKGDAKAMVDVSAVTDFLTKVPGNGLGVGLLLAEGTAEVAWKGGVMAGVAGTVGGALVRGGARLSVEGLTMNGLGGHGFVLFDNGKLSLKNVVIQNAGLGSSSGPDKAVIAMGGQNTEAPLSEALELDGTEISTGKGPAIVLSLYGNMPSKPTIKLSNSHIDGNAGPGIWVLSPGSLSPDLVVSIAIDGTTFKGNQGAGIQAARANLTVTGGQIGNNVGAGIQLDDATSKNALMVRGTTFTANMGDAIRFAGAAGSTLDLGQTGGEGKLVFGGVPAGVAAVHVESPIQGKAIGNTWLASQQGAGADGRYATATTLVGPVTGPNVTLAAGASLVLAE
jgi:hypothetical protein